MFETHSRRDSGGTRRILSSTIRAGVLLLILIGIAGCRTFDVQTDWDPTVAFERFARFHFVEPPEVEGANPFADNGLMRKRLRAAIEATLAERGFRAVETREQADFLVTYEVLLEERLRVDGVSSTADHFHRRRAGFGFGYTTANVRAYQEATLILDFLDPRDDELLWRGWGTGMLRTRDRDRGRERLQQGLRAILDRFPPDSDD